MRTELIGQEVLAMYDVRGIQNYIFKSNAAKEIIGASKLVEKIVTDGLNTYIKDHVEEMSRSKYMTDWEHDDALAFLKDKSIIMQVLFIGGGNAYVLFREGQQCQKINRFLAKYVLDKTYSLNLAVAVVKKTDSYKNDYAAINEEMRRIKAFMPSTKPAGALPFMAADTITGYPLTARDHATGDYICTEARLKRDNFPSNENEKVFDKMVTQKGDNSTLAVCHIDGNSMGIRIMTKMQGIASYEQAVPTMRCLSLEISETFGRAYDDMIRYMDRLAPQVKKDAENKLHRKIVAAGDDITFVCNAKLAIPAVRYFLEHVAESGTGDAVYSACGGIAFFNSHFPFSDAYQVAEACCDSAKKRAKEKENRGSGIGNFLDFQICTNIRAADLDAYRDKHYSAEGSCFIARPYFVPGAKDTAEFRKKNEKYDIERLIKCVKYFVNVMPRSKAKELRGIIPMGENELKKEISFLQSRGYMDDCSLADRGVWYDALELMDLYIDEEQADEDKN